MTCGFAASLILNAILACVVFRLLARRNGKPLPRKKPDFAEVERVLAAATGGPELAEFFDLDQFEAKEWLCQAILIHKVVDIHPHWNKIERLVRQVEQACAIPGRVAGCTFDLENPQRMMGTTLQFGYSSEVGYSHPNEFYEELQKKTEHDATQDGESASASSPPVT